MVLGAAVKLSPAVYPAVKAMILKSYPDAAALLPPADNWRFRSYNKPVPTGDLVSMIFSEPEQATALALKIVNVRGFLTPGLVE